MSPFSLKETHQYLTSRGVQLNIEQVTEIYMAIGGVAFYLDQVKAGESAAQFINNNLFSVGAVLREEFDVLFESLFENHRTHIELVKTLAKHPFGLSTAEISSELELSSGGSLSEVIRELEKSDFIQFNPRMGNKKREGVYRLVDEYSLFYLTWVEEKSRSFDDPSYWQRQVGQPRYNTWLGHAFENICFKHIPQIRATLGISGTMIEVSGFRNKKAQIDMIIDRNDKVMNLCEMKYMRISFEMSKAEAEKIQARKVELLATLEHLKKRRHIFVTLITPFSAKRNQHYLGLIDNEVNLEKLFI